MKLRDLAYTDLYVSVDCEAFLRGVPGAVGIVAPPEEVAPDLIGLHAVLSVSARERSEFSVRYDSVIYRVSTIASQQGRWWVCRRGMSRIPSIDELGIAPNLAELMVSLAQDRGLFLISGGAGQGKSTTAAAMMASWLHHFGDVGVAIENPPEAPLEGPHGEAGWCFQLDMEDSQIAEALVLARRWRPKFIYLGEINSPLVATQALRCAASQMAVVSTIYAGSQREAFEKFAKLAGADEDDSALELLSDGLTMGIHQRFASGTRRLNLEVLLPSRKPDEPIRQALRTGDFDALAGLAKTTAAKAKAGE
jgi:Tfp pilus assembly pilus retraction ATPase PilT